MIFFNKITVFQKSILVKLDINYTDFKISKVAV